MFGGLAALPLYLQIVKGASPTEAGLLLLPMTLGIMAGSIVLRVSSSPAPAATGIFPIIGAGAADARRCFVFHYVAADTPLWQTMIVMVVFGLGLGFNFQPLILAVQNAVPPQDIGVATSSATFFRQIGGTLGTAVFLSILFSTVPDKIAAAMRRRRADARLPGGAEGPGATPQFAAAVRAGPAVGRWRRVERRAQGQLVPHRPRPAPGQAVPRWASPTRWTWCSSSAPCVMVFGFLVLLFLPHVELRSGSAYSERGQADAEAKAEADAGHGRRQGRGRRPDAASLTHNTSRGVTARHGAR